jgi:hypothetical protein
LFAVVYPNIEAPALTPARSGSTAVRLGVWAVLVVLLSAGAAAAVSYTATVNGSQVTVTYEGNGTEGDPAMNSSGALDNHFRLSADIDAAATQGWNGGEGFHPIQRWSDGGLNGANHTIANLTIANTTSGERMHGVGLFGRVFGSDFDVSNIRLQAVNISGTPSNEESGTGALAGSLEEGGQLSRIEISGDVNGVRNTGGLTGLVNRGSATVFNVTVDVNINDSYTGSEGGAGGLIGKNLVRGDVLFQDILFSGNVSSDRNSGGIIGYTDGDVTVDGARGHIDVTSLKIIPGSSSLSGGVIGFHDSGTAVISQVRVNGSVVGRDGAGGFVGRNSGTLVEIKQSAGDFSLLEKLATFGDGGAAGFVGIQETQSSDIRVSNSLVNIGSIKVGNNEALTHPFVGSVENNTAIAINDSFAVVDQRQGTTDDGLDGDVASNTVNGQDVVVDVYYNESADSRTISPC